MSASPKSGNIGSARNPIVYRDLSVMSGCDLNLDSEAEAQHSEAGPASVEKRRKPEPKAKASRPKAPFQLLL